MTTNQRIMAVVGVAVAIVAIVIATRKDETPAASDLPIPTVSSGVDPSSPTASTVPVPGSVAPPIVSGKPIDVGELAEEAKLVESARALLRAGEPRKAMTEIERYDRRYPEGTLKQEETLLKIEAMSKAGRRVDALALGMSTRDNPSYSAADHDRVEAVLTDAGLIGPVAAPAVPK